MGPWTTFDPLFDPFLTLILEVFSPFWPGFEALFQGLRLRIASFLGYTHFLQ